MKPTSAIIVTGQSGAGIRTAIKSLEDLGYYCIDNLPIEMLLPVYNILLDELDSNHVGIAFGVRIYDEEKAQKFIPIKQVLTAKYSVDVVYLQAGVDSLVLRYSANRRKHPVTSSQAIVQSIKEEENLLRPVLSASDCVIDTTHLSPHQLKAQLEHRYEQAIPPRVLQVSFTSFGFKNGPLWPLEAMYDVRFLTNPYFKEHLKSKTGLDTEVQEFLNQDPLFVELVKRLEDWFLWLLPQYHKEGKHYLRVGIGCTGGQHRSVWATALLTKRLQEKHLDKIVIHSNHRDLAQPELAKHAKHLAKPSTLSSNL